MSKQTIGSDEDALLLEATITRLIDEACRQSGGDIDVMGCTTNFRRILVGLVNSARKVEVENVQLRKVLADALSAMRDWGAEEDGIPVDVGAWNAYCDGAALLGWCIDPAYAVEGANDE